MLKLMSHNYLKEGRLYSWRCIFFDNSLDITNPITLGIGSSLVTMSGNIDFLKMYSDLNIELMDASVFLINNFWSDSLNSGFANGLMDIKGSFNSINTNFNLNIEDFSYGI